MKIQQCDDDKSLNSILDEMEEDSDSGDSHDSDKNTSNIMKF